MESSGRTFDGYIRVSAVRGRTGPSYISPTIQKTAIERWATYSHVTIDQWHDDQDQSGGTQNRPGLREAIRRIEAHEIDGLAVWKLSRFARNVAGALRDLERIQAANGSVVFVEEQIDTSGPMGQFMLTVLLAVATLERENLKAGLGVAKQLAIGRGAFPGPTPYGYTRAADATLIPDPVQSEHMQTAYRLAATVSVRAAVQYLQERAPGRTWRTSTVRRALAKRLYLGEQKHGQDLNAEAHIPIVTRALWEAAQHPGSIRGPNHAYPLSGLARCATCGSAMIGARAGVGVRTYRCTYQSRHEGRPHCPRGAQMLSDSLEQHARSMVRLGLANRTLTVGDELDTADLAERELLDAEAELEAFASDQKLRQALGVRYHEHLQERVSTVERTQAKLAALTRSQQAVRKLRGSSAVDDMTDEAIAAFLRDISRVLLVEPGRGNVADRVFFADHSDLASRETLLEPAH